MKSIRKTILQFRQGNSDKVYEVELCEVSDARFVVHFRYGRRGSTLREGTKTTAPVSLDRANEIFDTLVESKTRKGYSEAESAPIPGLWAKDLDSPSLSPFYAGQKEWWQPSDFGTDAQTQGGAALDPGPCPFQA